MALVLAAAGCGSGETVLCSRTADLDRDGSMETVSITCKSWQGSHPIGGDIIITSAKSRKQVAVWRQPKLNPWKLEIADVDGDGLREVVVGVWKKSPKDPVMAKRVFVYSWNGKRLMPKWLGSRLGRRFDDFALADVNSDGWDELAALEIGKNGKHRVALYRWKSFGFDWLGCTGEVKGLASLTSKWKSITASGPRGRFEVVYGGGRITLRNI